MSETKPLAVCATCPWRYENHRKKHPAGWFNISNLKRLWNGIRTGEAPGMICHSTDPKNVEYGGDKVVKPGHERPCAGMVILVCVELETISHAATLREYSKTHALPMKRWAVARWYEKYLFGQLPPVLDQRAEVGLPWRPRL